MKIRKYEYGLTSRREASSTDTYGNEIPESIHHDFWGHVPRGRTGKRKPLVYNDGEANELTQSNSNILLSHPYVLRIELKKTVKLNIE